LHYTLDTVPFKIDKLPHHYLLTIPGQFALQFKNHKEDNIMKFEFYKEAAKAAHILFKGKGAEIEDKLTFFCK
jgi:hypothetical protein